MKVVVVGSLVLWYLQWPISSHHWLFTKGRAGQRWMTCEPVWAASSVHVEIAETGSTFWETINMLPHFWETRVSPSYCIPNTIRKRGILANILLGSCSEGKLSSNFILILNSMKYISKLDYVNFKGRTEWEFYFSARGCHFFSLFSANGWAWANYCCSKNWPFWIGAAILFSWEVGCCVGGKHLEIGDLDVISCSLKFPEPPLPFQ